MSEYGIAAFRSRQQVMRFEQMLNQAGVRTRVVSTPREVSVGCGLSVRFELSDVNAVRQVLYRSKPANLIGLYSVKQDGGERLQIKVISKQA